MKHKQGSIITGYVTVLVKGENPELFFQACNQMDVAVWDVKRVSSDVCKGNIRLNDMNKIKSVKRRTGYKLKFIHKRGIPFFMKRFMKKKGLILGMILSIMLILFLSNIIWEVKISGVPKDIEEKISKQLDNYGIHSGAWIFTLESENQIQQQLIKDVPELLWVGVQQKGTTFYLEGVEKIVVKEEVEKEPRNLIATKKGVIKNMYVSNGLPKVRVNDYVEEGDILVSGILNEEDNEDDDAEDNENELGLVAADGEITATTWYEVSVTVPLEGNYEFLTGNREKKYYVQIGKLKLPIWGFGSPEYEEIHREMNDESLYFFKWPLPVNIVETILSEKSFNNIERTKEEAVKIGIEQAKSELKLQLGPESQIISEKVLQETLENGKVKLNLYISVEENIATAQPLTKGSTKK
ncbi:sporulation protein YqfD [Virgibacillus ainsalahensis]